MTLRALGALTKREFLKWIRTPTAIVSSLLMPFFYLLLFGQALNLTKFLPAGGPPGVPTASALLYGAPDYYSFFSVGMVGFVVLFSSLFAGANVIFDKRFGVMKKLAAAPVPRWTLLGSRLLMASFRGMLFGGVVFAIAVLFAHLPGLNGLTILTGSPLGVLEILLAMAMLAAGFSAIFLGIGFAVEQIDSYFALVNLVNLPLLFSSTALFPRTIMPAWLQAVSDWNPVTLAVNVMRENLFPATGYAYAAPVYLGLLAAISAGLIALALVVTDRSLAAR